MGYQNKWVLCVLVVLGCQFMVPALEGAEESEINSTSEGDSNEDEVVSVYHGKIRGFPEKSSKGLVFYSFLGIPYAKPPTGNRRFKDPDMIEEEGWKGIRDGSLAPPPCSQVDLNSVIMSPKPTYKGEEDCLYLNIYTPMPNFHHAELPVMIFIHGGQFLSGEASDYKPYDLLNEPIVLVVIQYRLGILGFMSTEDLVMPGNLGLKDQTMALLWIHRNIESFGGSANSITVFGSGAGAASVHYQTLSHHTIGLFKRAILQSGNALCPWAQGGVHTEAAYYIGNQFKCFPDEDEKKNEETQKNEETEEKQKPPEEETLNKQSEGEKEKEEMVRESRNETHDPKESSENREDTSVEREKEEQKIKNEKLLSCLQNVDVEKLVTSATQLHIWSHLPVIFGPRIDIRYLPETPEFLLKMARHKRVHLIIGINREDGSLLTNSMFLNEGRRMALKHHFPLIGPISLEFSDDDIAPLNMTIKAYDHYVGGISFEADNVLNLTKLYTDRHYGVCSDMAAEWQAINNEYYKRDVYFYEFEHRGQRSTGDLFDLNFGRDWVSHGDELFYLFPMNKSNDFVRDEEDQKMTDLMTKLWFNFAESGNPTPNKTFDFIWEPYSKDHRRHLRLTTTPSMEEDKRKEAREFWTNLPTRQNVFFNKEYFSKILNGTDLKNDENSAGVNSTKEESDQLPLEMKEERNEKEMTTEEEETRNKDEL